MLGFDEFDNGVMKRGEVWKLGSTFLLLSALDEDMKSLQNLMPLSTNL